MGVRSSDGGKEGDSENRKKQLEQMELFKGVTQLEILL